METQTQSHEKSLVQRHKNCKWRKVHTPRQTVEAATVLKCIEVVNSIQVAKCNEMDARVSCNNEWNGNAKRIKRDKTLMFLSLQKSFAIPSSLV